MSDDCLIVSIAKLKEDRFVWIVKTGCAREPEHHGYAGSWFAAADDCERARKEIDPLEQMPILKYRNVRTMGIPAGAARMWHSKKAREKRKLKPSNTTDAASREFVYHVGYAFDESPYREVITRNQILKRTAKKVFISAAHEGYPNPREATYALDRERLERDGFVSHRGSWTTYYLSPPEADKHEPPRAFAVLGLSYPATKEEVKKAFRRKSKEAHPDKGGTAATFVALQDAYKRALGMTHQ
jgi:hypothetical protein